MKINRVGEGQVVLIASGNKVYTDIAARFCKSNRDLEAIIATPYDKDLLRKVIDSGHLAATEFDYFLFGFSGYSRIVETQLVRKRMASYMISSGRVEHNGKREFEVVLPESILDNTIEFHGLCFNYYEIIAMLEKWYNYGVENGIPEEDLRYLKPQATISKGIIGMNTHSLLDFFNVRCCLNAQSEIRDLANKMLALCKADKPDLFKDAGASCVKLGYCPQNELQNKMCKKPTHKDVLAMLRNEQK